VNPARLLEGKVAIVSGVGPGMGRDIALLFAQHGADLVLGARNTERVSQIADELRASGARAEVVALDITDPTSCEAAAAAALGGFGRIDVLVNNAFRDVGRRSFEESDLSDYRKALDVNLLGTLQMTKAVVPAMTEQADGRVVMVNTMSTHRIRAGFGAYAASKAALESATKTLAVELGPSGIRVNGIHPGFIWGDSVEWYFGQLAGQRGITAREVYDEIAGETALRYLPPSSEIAGSVLFFASDLSKPVTGQSLGVDCGHWIAG
jgi:NAD(P)-dependent dehydrogenase (short-subunit alcohol dehydrogenase family)